MKKSIFAKLLVVIAPVVLLAGCGGKNEVNYLTLDTDATIPEGQSLLDQINIGMSEADIKSVLDANKVDYSAEEGIISGTTMVNFLSFDSSCEYLIGEDATESASYSLYFKDEKSHDEAGEVLAAYLLSKMDNGTVEDIVEDPTSETYYYPIERFEVDGEEFVYFLSLASVEYYDIPAEGYTDLGYDITEEYMSAEVWDKLASGEVEEEE